MVRERIIKPLSLPALGISFPLALDLFPREIPFASIAFTSLLLLITAFLIWKGSRLIHKGVANRSSGNKTSKNLLNTCFPVAAYSSVLSVLSFSLWKEYLQVNTPVFLDYSIAFACALVMVMITLVYEVRSLHRDKLLNSRMVGHLDRELVQAEMHMLRNELDPHFVYNSLMPLYYLVRNDSRKAEAFACKLIQVYQYFLQNRQNDFIRLSDELHFIENYFYLLQIRYKDAIRLSLDIERSCMEQMVLPLSLQILVENAIKHNEPRREEELHVHIRSQRSGLVVSNNLIAAADGVYSSGIGLRNLRKRYKISTGEDISVVKTTDKFMVTVPLVTKARIHDVNSYHRG